MLLSASYEDNWNPWTLDLSFFFIIYIKEPNPAVWYVYSSVKNGSSQQVALLCSGLHDLRWVRDSGLLRGLEQVHAWNVIPDWNPVERLPQPLQGTRSQGRTMCGFTKQTLPWSPQEQQTVSLLLIWRIVEKCWRFWKDSDHDLWFSLKIP